MKIVIIIIYILISSINSSKATEEETDINFYKLIEQYILDNPEIIIESLEKYSEKEKIKKQQESKKTLYNFYNNKNYKTLPSIGSISNELILIEFIDYNCGYCKKTLTTITKLVKEVNNLKVVFVDFPILTESSELAARASLAANRQNAYFKYHSALLNYNKPITEDFLISTAQNLNLNLKEFKKDMNLESVLKQIGNNIKLANSLQIRGTPTFIVGESILPGAYDYKKLKDIILNNNL